MHVSRKIVRTHRPPPHFSSENCFSKPSAAVCLCCGGGGGSRHPLFQAASNNMLAPQPDPGRASRQTSSAGGVFLGLSNKSIWEGGWPWGSGWSGHNLRPVLKYLEQVDLNFLTSCCSLLLCVVFIWFGDLLFNFIFPSDLYWQFI